MESIVNKGFSLIEILLTVAMASAIISITIPFYLSVQRSYQLRISRDTVIDAIHSARLASLHQTDNSNWGVYCSDGIVTFFSGNSYLTRTQDRDVTHNLQGSTQCSTPTEIDFNLAAQIPQETIFTLNTEGKTSQVTVNIHGAISY